MRTRRPPSALLFVGVLATVGFVACGDDDDAPSARTTTSRSTTSTTASTTTTAFAGSTSPTSVASHASATALLAGVRVEDGLVTFVFRGDAPGVDAKYVEPPITEDASGKTVDVDGNAFLSIRMEPASAVDLSSGEPKETYTGPDRIKGQGPVTEIVETGDFEANLTWVIGLDAMRPYRVEVANSTVRVYVST